MQPSGREERCAVKRKHAPKAESRAASAFSGWLRGFWTLLPPERVSRRGKEWGGRGRKNERVRMPRWLGFSQVLEKEKAQKGNRDMARSQLQWNAGLAGFPLWRQGRMSLSPWNTAPLIKGAAPQQLEAGVKWKSGAPLHPSLLCPLMLPFHVVPKSKCRVGFVREVDCCSPKSFRVTHKKW